MEFAFYFSAGITVVSTLRVITNSNPVHALLYLIITLPLTQLVSWLERRQRKASR